MATAVETDTVKIFIDPSAALGPSLYGLPPHPKETQALAGAKKTIATIARTCDAFVISHFHYDHYDPTEDFYADKRVFAKDRPTHINKSQMARAKSFEDRIGGHCTLTFSDNSMHEFGETKLIFSPPFFHGPAHVRLGYVIMTTIDDGTFRVLHASDVQGPVTADARDYIIRQAPNLLIMDGPPTLFLGWRFSYQNLQDAANNLMTIIKKVGCDVVLDHHLLRDLQYTERFQEPFTTGKVQTFAEYNGLKNRMLEAHRKSLWKQSTPE
jgi:predicted metallo-beta-lactamase superfamily hydrolase